MAPYTMQIKITNNTNGVLNPLGAVIYNGYGFVKEKPSSIPAGATGHGGVLSKEEGSAGLFGLVAYATPDPTQNLVIWVTMPSTTGTKNHCSVGFVSNTMPIDQALAVACQQGSLGGFSEARVTNTFSTGGKKFALVVDPKVDDPSAYQTTSEVVVDLYTQ